LENIAALWLPVGFLQFSSHLLAGEVTTSCHNVFFMKTTAHFVLQRKDREEQIA
jgi:hypothetical protein